MPSNKDSLLLDKKVGPFLAVPLVIILVYIRFFTNDRPMEDAYYKLQVNDRITLLSYEHGVPLVYLKHGKTKFTLYVPPSTSTALRDQDSVVKHANSPFMQVIRDSAQVRITTTWEIQRDDVKPPVVHRTALETTR